MLALYWHSTTAYYALYYAGILDTGLFVLSTLQVRKKRTNSEGRALGGA